jgi:putative membrane protein
MIFLKNVSKSDLDKIKNCVGEVEKKTSGEIVPAIIEKSDLYPGALWRIAFATSLLLTYVLYFFIDDLHFSYYLIAEILFIPVGFFIGKIPFVFRLAITDIELEEEVYQKALELFHSEKVSNTRDRTGILIMASRLERKIIILADSGINEKVTKEFWDEIVEKMSLKIKMGQYGEAFCEAINIAGEKLNQNFPVKKDDTNELSNHVVVE